MKIIEAEVELCTQIYNSFLLKYSHAGVFKIKVFTTDKLGTTKLSEPSKGMTR